MSAPLAAGKPQKFSFCRLANQAASAHLRAHVPEPRLKSQNHNTMKSGEKILQKTRKCAYLLELLDGTLVDTAALVDQVTSL